MRSFPVFLVLIALLTFPAIRTLGQDAPVELRLKVAKGEVISYQTAIAVNANRLTARWAMRVIDVAGDGIALIESVMEDIRQADGTMSDRLEQPWLGRVRPDGTVAERFYGEELITDFPLPLPAGPVRVGDSWKRTRTEQREDMKLAATVTATLERVETTAEGRMAKIRIRSDGSGGSKSGVRVTLRGSEDITWSIDRGRVARYTTERTITAEMQLILPDRNIPMTSTVKETMDGRLLEPPPPAAPVAPDVLIAPGKGFGTTLLEQPLDAIRAQLGTPDPEEHPALRAKAVRWWVNDLVAFIDPADDTKLVGLMMTDRRCRTEKGIGVGSTEGAVLFAYGLDPAKVTLTVPKVGDVKVLAYDDQGIAFLIVTRRVEGATWKIPPVGTVYASVVFPEKGAAKIFTLP